MSDIIRRLLWSGFNALLKAQWVNIKTVVFYIGEGRKKMICLHVASCGGSICISLSLSPQKQHTCEACIRAVRKLRH